MKEAQVTLAYKKKSPGWTQSALPLWQTSGARRTADIMTGVFHYVIILSLSFVFLYPVLFMISQSLMTARDAADGTVQWIPKGISFENFAFAFRGMGFMEHFINSIILSVGGALLHLVGCSIAGYGFARYRFPGYTVLIVLLLFTFLVPPQAIVVPLYLLFSRLDWLNTYSPLLIPNLFGHGLRGALFVMVFMQFFRGLPHQMEEAARIDGAGAFRTFLSIMLPMAKPAILVVFLFSIVWHWNDSYFPDLYLKKTNTFTLNQMLGNFRESNFGQQKEAISESGDAKDGIGQLPTNHEKMMAGALMTILPILILYLYTQRYFVESVERTGIAGE